MTLCVRVRKKVKKDEFGGNGSVAELGNNGMAHATFLIVCS